MTAADYFDALYAAKADPWDLSSSPYERRKLALVLAALPRRRYQSGFEPGCAIGVTTVGLAPRCVRLIAMDGAASAVGQTRTRVEASGRQVWVAQGTVPTDWPEATFDLVVLSELLYYLGDEARTGVLERVVSTVQPQGDVVAVHWRHPFAEAPTTGEHVHAELRAGLGGAGYDLLVDHVEPDFLLQVYRAPTRGGGAHASVQ